MDNDWRVREALHNTFAVLVHTLSLRHRYWLLRSMHLTCKDNWTQPLLQIGIVGKKLATQLKSLIGPWLCCQFDPATEVRTIAKSTFAVCRTLAIQPTIALSRSFARVILITPSIRVLSHPRSTRRPFCFAPSRCSSISHRTCDKRRSRFVCDSSSFSIRGRRSLENACSSISRYRIRVASEGSSASENQEKYDRSVSSTLQAFAFVLGMRYGTSSTVVVARILVLMRRVVDQIGHENAIQKLDDIMQVLNVRVEGVSGSTQQAADGAGKKRSKRAAEAADAAAQEPRQSHSIWSFLDSSNYSIRSAAYRLAQSLCATLPEAFEPNQREITTAVLQSIGDKDARSHAAFWDCILTILHSTCTLSFNLCLALVCDRQVLAQRRVSKQLEHRACTTDHSTSADLPQECLLWIDSSKLSLVVATRGVAHSRSM